LAIALGLSVAVYAGAQGQPDAGTGASEGDVDGVARDGEQDYADTGAENDTCQHAKFGSGILGLFDGVILLWLGAERRATGH
jgi:hypothetical protein